MEKEKYYVFLDIDGTLWDYEYRMYNNNGLLKPQSMEALNYLLDRISDEHDVQIVMTSRRRKQFDSACKLLYDSGLKKCYKNIDKTPWVEGDRGKKILDYMKNSGQKFIYDNNILKQKLLRMLKKPIFDRYVVLEDESDKVVQAIPKDKLISPNIISNALSMDMVKNFLTKEGILGVSHEKE